MSIAQGATTPKNGQLTNDELFEILNARSPELEQQFKQSLAEQPENPQTPDLAAAEKNAQREKGYGDMMNAELVEFLHQQKAKLAGVEWNTFLRQFGKDCGSRADVAIKEFLNPAAEGKPDILLPFLGRNDTEFAEALCKSIPKNILFRKDGFVVEVVAEDKDAGAGRVQILVMNKVRLTTWIEQLVTTGRKVEVEGEYGEKESVFLAQTMLVLRPGHTNLSRHPTIKDTKRFL